MMKRVEMAFSMAVSQIIPVERVKGTAVVIMAVLMRYPMLFSVEGFLQTQVREQIQVVLLTRKQKTSPTAGASAVKIRLPSVQQKKQKTSPTAGAFAERIRLRRERERRKWAQGLDVVDGRIAIRRRQSGSRCSMQAQRRLEGLPQSP